MSFELGRPLGPPSDANFQRRVLEATLSLLQAPSGPVLEDYPIDAPQSNSQQGPWACPVNFSRAAQAPDDQKTLSEILFEEFAQLKPWYERALGKSGRTSFGVSNLDLQQIAELLESLLQPQLPASPNAQLALADVVRLALEDIKSYYFEAASAQPGEPSSSELRGWFWQQTQASEVLRMVGQRLADSDDPIVAITGQVLVVPRAEA